LQQQQIIDLILPAGLPADHHPKGPPAWHVNVFGSDLRGQVVFRAGPAALLDRPDAGGCPQKLRDITLVAEQFRLEQELLCIW
jgi:hypothetical protein